MKILRVNMESLETTIEKLPKEMEILGGRGLSARILRKEVPPKTDALSGEAKLIFAVGPLAATKASSCGRMSVGGKSPLTLGIKEANVGGPTGQKLDKLGIRAIIIEKKPVKEQVYSLILQNDSFELVPAEELQGKSTYEVSAELRKIYGSKIAIVCIGLAGERKLKSATVTFSDKDGDCSRHAARGGLGAVMGAKGLKAIVVNDEETDRPEIKDKELFKQTQKEWTQSVKDDRA